LPGLSVRVQIPVNKIREKIRYLKLVSKSVNGKPKKEFVGRSSFGNWQMKCTEEEDSETKEMIISECIFTKEGMNLKVIPEEGKIDKYTVEIEIFKDLPSCELKDDKKECKGYCVYSGGMSACIQESKKNEIENILIYTGLIKNFDELVNAYSVIKNGIITETKAIPNYPAEKNIEDIIWSSALKKELVWMKENDIIGITNGDINKISEFVKQGRAGVNNRIVYAKDKIGEAKWIYYKDSIEPELLDEKICDEYNIDSGITGLVVIDKKNVNLYYLVPIVITIILILLIFVAILFARLRHEIKKNKERQQQEKIKKEIKEAKEKRQTIRDRIRKQSKRRFYNR